MPNPGSLVKFMELSSSQYQTLVSRDLVDNNTIYFIYEGEDITKIMLGDRQYTTQARSLVSPGVIDGVNFDGWRQRKVCHYSVCETASSDSDKLIVINNFSSSDLEGSFFFVRFKQGNTADPSTLKLAILDNQSSGSEVEYYPICNGGLPLGTDFSINSNSVYLLIAVTSNIGDYRFEIISGSSSGGSGGSGPNWTVISN